MGRQQQRVELARVFYGLTAVTLMFVAIGALAPAVTGDPGGCHVVLSLGAPGALVPASGPASQPVPGPSVPGVPSLCNQYLEVGLPVVLILLGLVLLVAAVPLGREARTWGPIVAVGAMAGIVAAFGAAYAVVGTATSDQQAASPGLVPILIAGVPVLLALASAVIVWKAYQHGEIQSQIM